jgi:predicted amidohydrolase YtcJ
MMAGATIIPGVIDGHVHARELGMDAIKVDLVGVRSIDEIVERLVQAHPDPEPGRWIIGQGWDEGEFASAGYPDRESLDRAFPETPVALESLHGFAGMYNGAALRIAGVDATTPDPEGGTILRRKDDSPSGVMLALAQGLVNQHLPAPSREQLRKAIVEGLTIMASAGVTSVHEAGMSTEDVAAYRSLADEGRLPIRVYGMLTGNDAQLMEAWFERGPLEHPSGFLDIRGVKVFYDGSLGSRTAVLAAPYADAPEHAAPAERIRPERIVELGKSAAKRGFQLAVHAIGDEGNQRVLQAYAESLDAHPKLDHRWRIEHAQVVAPEFFEMAAKMGVIASMQPSHAVGDSDWAQDRLGPERISRAYAWRTMLDAGVRLILNSDLPGEPWKPMQTLYFAVTRSKLDGTPAGGWFPSQALTVEEALAAMTRDSAYAAFSEDTLGRLAVGYEADFVVLGANPLTIEPRKLAEVEVLETWVAGRRVESPPSN